MQHRSRAPFHFHLRVLARPLVPVSVTAFRNACYTISYRIGPRGRISQCTLIRHTIRPVTFTHRGGPVQSRLLCSHTLSGDACTSAARLFVICLVCLGVPEGVATGHRMLDPNFLVSAPTILPLETLVSPSIIFTRLVGTPLHTSTCPSNRVRALLIPRAFSANDVRDARLPTYGRIVRQPCARSPHAAHSYP